MVSQRLQYLHIFHQVCVNISWLFAKHLQTVWHSENKKKKNCKELESCPDHDALRAPAGNNGTY